MSLPEGKRKTKSSYAGPSNINGNRKVMAKTALSSLLSFRNLILFGVLLQNTGYTLLRKYSTMTEQVSSKEILLVSELIKIVFSTYITIQNSYSNHENSDAKGTGVERVVWLLSNSSRMLVLATIYGVMNILSFVALIYIGAGEFTICAQLKILSTAMFSVLVLGTSLSIAKWRALGLLVIGCVLVASPSLVSNDSSSSDSPVYFRLLFGYGSVLTEVALSGFASIYFEKVVKSTKEVITIWERNFQLGVYSIVMYGSIILYENSSGKSSRTAWSNWSLVTLLVSLFGAVGGLLVAATLKYADSILKTIATAGAIVFSTILGHYLLNGPMNFLVFIGAIIVIFSVYYYTFDGFGGQTSSASTATPSTITKNDITGSVHNFSALHTSDEEA